MTGSPTGSEWLNTLVRCWCCDSMLAIGGYCPVCDLAGLMSPPHLCVANGMLITDEYGSEAFLAPIAPDHESAAAR